MRLNGTTPKQLLIDDITFGIKRSAGFAQTTPDILIIDYDALYDKDKEKVRLIADYLEIELSDKEIHEITEKTDIKAARKVMSTLEDGTADPATQLRWHHIGEHSGKPGFYNGKLPQWLKKEIKKRCS